MKTTLPNRRNRFDLRPGLSSIELTVIMSVLIALIAVLFVGVKAYKSGSDRAACVMNIHSMQNAVRSFSNLKGLNPGQDVPDTDLNSELVGPDRFVEEKPSCPGGGAYAYLGNRIPAHGELYLSCSLAGEERHQPTRINSW